MNKVHLSLYPWLLPLYDSLQSAFLNQRLARTLSFRYVDVADCDLLLDAFIALIFCQTPVHLADQNRKIACGHCHACLLLKAQTHPDFHVIACQKGKQNIAIEQIRALHQPVYECAQQGGNKVIWIREAELLSDAAANALLKMIEEPPEHCFFICSNRIGFELLPTIKSRCVTFNVLSPTFEVGLAFMQQEWQRLPKFTLNRTHEQQFASALLLMNGSPIKALTVLRSALWNARDQFYQKISAAFQTQNLWALRSFLTQEESRSFLFLCFKTLIADAIKAKNRAGKFIFNRDHGDLVRQIYVYPPSMLLRAMQQCEQTELDLNAFPNLNRELFMARLLAQLEMTFFKFE